MGLVEAMASFALFEPPSDGCIDKAAKPLALVRVHGAILLAVRTH